jgi:hypothetical protein
MLEGLEFAVTALLAVGMFGFTSNALVVLSMYYGRKVILIVVRDHLV